jgi:hypothetical protein
MLNFRSNLEVKFIKREANMAAQTLVRATKSWASRILFDVIPHCIKNIVINYELIVFLLTKTMFTF